MKLSKQELRFYQEADRILSYYEEHIRESRVTFVARLPLKQIQIISILEATELIKEIIPLEVINFIFDKEPEMKNGKMPKQASDWIRTYWKNFYEVNFAGGDDEVADIVSNLEGLVSENKGKLTNDETRILQQYIIFFERLMVGYSLFNQIENSNLILYEKKNN